MTTRHPSYVVAEIPEPIRSEIQAVRDEFATLTARLPVEITLLGSSGTGPIPAGTSVQLIRDAIESIFSDICHWEACFSEVRIFPNTSIAYLAPADRRPFERAHEILCASSLPFSASPFPYNPHCTLRSGGTFPKNVSCLLTHPFPTASFLIDTISVYELDERCLGYELICQKRLRQKQSK